MKARLKYYNKIRIGTRYVVELSIHEVGRSMHYSDGVKYGFICKDLETGRYVLLDNHHPKGPHLHVDDREESYLYVSDEQLMEDFKMIVFRELEISI